MQQSQIDLSDSLSAGSIGLARSNGLGAIAKHYVALLKPRPMSVVIFSAVAGLVAARASIDLASAIIAIFCIALGGGGSAALNMWFEADTDAKMRRTAGRVLPSGRLKPRDALAFGIAASTASIAIMAWQLNAAAACALAATIFCYGVLYTMAMKHRTVLSVPVAGALAGVLTPLTGWSAAAGSIDQSAMVLFAYVFFWTPPHVWSQAIYRVADYERAGIPMLPAVAGLRAAKIWVLIFTIVHAVMAAWPYFTGDAGVLYLSVSGLAGAGLTWKAITLLRSANGEETVREARAYFRLSIAYIVTLLIALCLDRLLLAP